MSGRKKVEETESRLEHVLSVGLQRSLFLKGPSIGTDPDGPASKRARTILTDLSIEDAVKLVYNRHWENRAAKNVVDDVKDSNPFYHPKYGNINRWDTSNVVDMSRLFEVFEGFDFDHYGVRLDEWDTSKVETMAGMFASCNNFTSDLSRWQVDRVTDMSEMFYDCNKFKSDLSGWRVDRVTDMSHMFYECNEFTSNLSTWKVGEVTNMSNMFYSCTKFTSDLSKWKVDAVNNMSSMFHNCSGFTSDLSKWEVDIVKDMSSMFHNCSGFTSDLSKWEVDIVKDMSSMFDGCDEFTSDLSEWNVENVNTTTYMFAGCIGFTSDLSKWEVGKVTDMSNMFEDCRCFTSNLSKWKVGKVTNMARMFYRSAFDPGSTLKYWDVGSCTDFRGMFAERYDHERKGHEPKADLSAWKLNPRHDINQLKLHLLFTLQRNEFQNRDIEAKRLVFPVGFLQYDQTFDRSRFYRDQARVETQSEGGGLVVRYPLPYKQGYNSCVMEPASKGVVASFQRLMNATDPHDFKRHRRDWSDVGPFGGYQHLKVAKVYEIHNPASETRYEAARERLTSVMQTPFCKENYKSVQHVRTDKIVADLVEEGKKYNKRYPGDPEHRAYNACFDEDVSEKLLLHGTGPEQAFSIAANGFFSPEGRLLEHGNAYGTGVYFAEDAAKIDAYSKSSRHRDIHGEYPDLLAQHFAKSRNIENYGMPLECNMYYMLASRVMLGCAAHLRGGQFFGNRTYDITTEHSPRRSDLFHSSIVEYGNKEGELRKEWDPDEFTRTQDARFREFVVRDVDQVLPMFLVVYERVSSDDYKLPHDYDDLNTPPPKPPPES